MTSAAPPAPVVSAGPSLDDRWADRFAASAHAFAVFVLVISLVPAWHHYLASYDVVSSLGYAALPAVLGAGLAGAVRLS
jgi:hypothetical protein